MMFPFGYQSLAGWRGSGDLFPPSWGAQTSSLETSEAPTCRAPAAHPRPAMILDAVIAAFAHQSLASPGWVPSAPVALLTRPEMPPQMGLAKRRGNCGTRGYRASLEILYRRDPLSTLPGYNPRRRGNTMEVGMQFRPAISPISDPYHP